MRQRCGSGDSAAIKWQRRGGAEWSDGDAAERQCEAADSVSWSRCGRRDPAAAMRLRLRYGGPSASAGRGSAGNPPHWPFGDVVLFQYVDSYTPFQTILGLLTATKQGVIK